MNAADLGLGKRQFGDSEVMREEPESEPSSSPVLRSDVVPSGDVGGGRGCTRASLSKFGLFRCFSPPNVVNKHQRSLSTGKTV